MADEASVRGVLLIGFVDWLVREHGQRYADELIDRQPVEVQDLVRGRALIQTSRVSASLFRALAVDLIAEHGLEGPKGFRSAAAHIATEDLASYMKMLISLGSPEFVVKRFPRVWRHYFDTGTLKVTIDGPHTAEVVLEGAAIYGAAGLEGAVGWMRAALAISRAKRPSVERLDTSGDPARYRVRWE